MDPPIQAQNPDRMELPPDLVPIYFGEELLDGFLAELVDGQLSQNYMDNNEKDVIVAIRNKYLGIIPPDADIAVRMVEPYKVTYHIRPPPPGLARVLAIQAQMQARMDAMQAEIDAQNDVIMAGAEMPRELIGGRYRKRVSRKKISRKRVSRKTRSRRSA